MTTSLRALGWPVVRRHQWGLIAVLAAVVASAAAAAVAQVVLEPTQAMSARVIASLLLLMSALYLAGVFSYGFDSDVSAVGTCFPARQFTLPVRTVELAGWPVLVGSAVLALLWVIVALVLFRQSGVEVPVGWPALLVAAQLTWVQALLWWPFGLPWARPITAIVFGHLPATGMMLARNLDAPPWVVPTYLGTAFGLGAAAAVAAVARSRRGIVPAWDWLLRLGRAATAWRSRRGHFASTERAQDWYEWRRHGYVLPLLTVVTLPIFGLLALFVDDHDPPKLMRALTLALAVPVFFAGMGGTVGGKQNPWVKSTYGVSSFTATRPVSSAGLVAAILRAAIRTTLIAWAVAAVMIGGAVYLSGAYLVFGNMGRDWLDARPAGEVVATVVVAAAVLLILTWKRLVEGLLIGLTGREWLIKGSVLVGLFLFFGLLLFALWLLIRPEYHHYIPELMPWVLATLVGLKFLAGAAAVRGLRRKRLVADPTLAKLAVAWLAVYATLLALLARVVPGELVPAYTLAMGVALVMPLARVSAMPLALDWNRHR
jgi:hypothetical protein